MAESTDEERPNRDDGAEEENDDEDYMGDLSKFIPPELSQNSTSKKLPSDSRAVNSQTLRKKAKTQNWQEQRKQEKERKQLEEDQQTLASLDSAIPQSNVGFKLLKQMGYKPGSALGKEGSGRAEPIGLDIRRSRAGIGRDDPLKEKMKKEKRKAEKAEKIKMKEEELMVEFGSRQKSQWRSRRVVVNFEKAKATLDQLENREVVVEPKEDDGERENDEKEEEEEVITEEDLLELLMKLRDEHRYCLFCGHQYDSTEDLLSNCSGVNEDDH